MGLKIDFQNHCKEYANAIPKAKQRALERCGEKGEEIASGLAPKKTGHLSQTITHKTDGDSAVEIGTNCEYAAYVELGTGVYCTMGGGRSGWWVYVPGSSGSHRSGKTYTYEEARQIVAIMRSEGIDAYMTQGQVAQPYLKPAVADNTGTYRNIIESEFKNG